MNEEAGKWMRCFLAVELDEAVRESLGRALKRLRATGAKVTWVRDENLHLTLVFLGEILTKRMETVRAVLNAACEGIPGFPLSVTGLGTFGSPGRPRVVWAGIVDPPPVLLDLQRTLSDRLREKGFEIERRAYHPHITLGRVRGPAGADALTSRVDSDKNKPFGTFSVRRVVCLRSQPEGGSVVYAEVHQAPLGGS